MWIRKSEIELRAFRRQSRLRRLGAALGAWLVFSIFATIVPGLSEYGEGLALSSSKIMQRFPTIALIASPLLLLALRRKCSLGGAPRQGEAVVCCHCNAVKAYDGEVACACGGVFRRMDELKWTEDVERQ
jgi:hypothetical protein